jgi:hypothetical protein
LHSIQPDNSINRQNERVSPYTDARLRSILACLIRADLSRVWLVQLLNNGVNFKFGQDKALLAEKAVAVEFAEKYDQGSTW